MSTSPDDALATTAPIQVVVLDPRRLLREGVCALLSRSPDLTVRGASSPSEILLADVLVVGAGSATEHLPGDVPVVRLDEIGATCRPVEAVRAAAVGPRHGGAGNRQVPALSTREQSILNLVGRGCSAAEIGRELGISPRTVERHKQSVAAKLGAPNQANAVARSLMHGSLSAAGYP